MCCHGRMGCEHVRDLFLSRHVVVVLSGDIVAIARCSRSSSYCCWIIDIGRRRQKRIIVLSSRRKEGNHKRPKFSFTPMSTIRVGTNHVVVVACYYPLKPNENNSYFPNHSCRCWREMNRECSSICF